FGGSWMFGTAVSGGTAHVSLDVTGYFQEPGGHAMRSRWTQRAPLAAPRVFPGSRSLSLRTLLSSALLALTLTSHAAAAAARFYTVPPCRVLDTRGSLGTFGGPALAPGANRSFFLAPNSTLA